jgi:HPt (histidine-containing phosphotransfer) domain-containing protein
MDAFVGKPLTPEKLRKVFVTAGRRKLAAAAMPLAADIPSAKIDLAMLSYLSDGSPESMHAEIARFVASLREAEASLAAASRAGDYARLSVCAHQLLGQAKIIGGAALAEAAQRLEAAARGADHLACAECLGRVQVELGAVTESMSRRQPDLHPA